ncbi:hypothetical protein FS837_001520 [Tulasnella sp. UAMH 9824]|nr:hypothetical protein FS837_001520 [Tulasnella sp. UAMH 9824]
MTNDAADEPVAGTSKRDASELGGAGGRPWKVPEFERPENLKAALLDESSFATLFPKYREKYLREIWPVVTKSLEPHGISCMLDLIHGSMSVRTTRKAWDPSMILKARDLIKLLSRGVPANQAIKILDDAVFCDIIKIGNMVSSKEKFVKRRQRIVGPEGSTLKAVELLTSCYVLVQGNTVSVMGPARSLPEVRRIVTDCMRNIHPIYRIKELMIRRELAKDPKLADASWDRFLPKYKKRNLTTAEKTARKRAKKGKEGSGGEEENAESGPSKGKKVKKAYTPFPPPIQPRKVDIEMETGEYWLKPQVKKAKEEKEKLRKQLDTKAQRKAEKEKVYAAPVEVAEDTAEERVRKRKAEQMERSKESRRRDKKRKVDESSEDEE